MNLLSRMKESSFWDIIFLENTAKLLSYAMIRVLETEEKYRKKKLLIEIKSEKYNARLKMLQNCAKV